jgi:hypothetical protein
MGFLRLSRLPNVNIGRTLIGADNFSVGMFKNLMMGSISFPSTDQVVDPSIINIDGYPTSTPPSDFGRSISFSSQLTTSDTLILSWTGVADIKLDRGAPGFTVISDTAGLVQGGTGSFLRVKSTTNVDCRVTFQFASSVPSSISIYFMSGVAGLFDGTLRNLVLCKSTDEASIAAATTPEELISDAFVDKYKELRPKIIRPMDATNPNSGNQSQSRYITPWQTGISCLGERWIPRCWAGTTAATTNSYSCAKPDDSGVGYVDGEVVQLKFVNASTGSVTLDSGLRGAKPVFSRFGVQLGNGDIAANTLATCVYDSVYDGFMYKAGGIQASIPYEYQIALANRVGADVWLNFPAYYDSASISAIATLARTQLYSNHTAYFEYSNEMWNSGFAAFHWAYVKGGLLGFITDSGRNYYGWQALRTREAMGLVTTAWSPRTTSQLKRVMPFQCFGDTTVNELYLFKGADLAPSGTHTGSGNSVYNAYTSSADYTQSPDRPIDYSDVMSYATYYSGAQFANFDANWANAGGTGLTTGGPSGWTTGIVGAADAYALGGSTNIANAFAFVDWDIRQGTNNGAAGAETLLALTSRYSAWNALAVTYNKTIECYEGAHESWYPTTATCTSLGISTDYGGSTGKFAVLLDAYKKDALFQTLVTDQYTQFMAESESTTWAWLVLTGVSQWGVMQGFDIFTATYKSWDAQVAINH